MGAGGISGFLVSLLTDYPNYHNCIAMGRFLHASLINLINISSRQHEKPRQPCKNKEIPLGIELVFSSSLRTEAVGSTVAVREANSNHGPVTLSLSCTVYFIHSEHT